MLARARPNQESALSGQLAYEEFEHCSLGLAMFQIGLDHVELIEIGEQWTGCEIHLRAPDGSCLALVQKPGP